MRHEREHVRYNAQHTMRRYAQRGDARCSDVRVRCEEARQKEQADA